MVSDSSAIPAGRSFAHFKLSTSDNLRTSSGFVRIFMGQAADVLVDPAEVRDHAILARHQSPTALLGGATVEHPEPPLG